MEQLIGKRCAITFIGDPSSWPLEGCPGFARVEAVDMPMIRLVCYSKDFWINCSQIKTIREF